MDDLDLQATVRAFLSAFVSETLAARGLYPPSAFAPARVLGACARRARHPGLCAYVDKAAAALTDPVIKGDVSQVAVLILDAAGAVVERFVASLTLRPEILASVEPADVEAALRSALLKLRFVDGALAPLPPHCTFEVVAAASARGALPSDEWGDAAAAAKVASPLRGAGAGARSPPPPGVLPLKTADAGGGALKLNVFYVEAAA